MDYSTVTETPGTRVTYEALSMLLTRYRVAAGFCEGKEVLEVACGSGQGLGYLAGRARRVIGGDVTAELLRIGRRHYGDRMPLLRLDAHALPFRVGSFDLVILFEAIYYLAQPERFLKECRRVLRNGGIIVISTPNREWPDFNPSPFSSKYFSAQELDGLLRRQGFSAELFGAFPAERGTPRDRVVSMIRRTAVSLNLIPKTMKGKERLKRIFLGKLTPLPSEVNEGMSRHCPLTPVPTHSPISDFKVLYAVGRLL